MKSQKKNSYSNILENVRMWFIVVICLVGFIFLFAPKTMAVGGDATREVIFSEIMWAGSWIGDSASTYDEWIELYNMTDEAIDLRDWKLRSLKSEDDYSDLIISGETTIIPSHGYFLISHFKETDERSVLNISPDFYTSSFPRLPNENLHLKLLDKEGNPIDEAGKECENEDKCEPFAGSNKTPKSSMVRKLLNDLNDPNKKTIGLGNKEGSWTSATTAFNLDPDPEVLNLAHPKPIKAEFLISEDTAVVSLTVEARDLDGSDNISQITADFEQLGLGNIPLGQSADGIWTIPPQTTVDLTTLPCRFDIPIFVDGGSDFITATYLKASHYQNAGLVRINEILPAPKDTNAEWIELYNFGEKEINLCGWSLDDKVVGSAFLFDKDTKLKPGEYLVLAKSLTGIALNNDTDILTLFNPKGEVYFQTEYKGLKYDESWNFTDSGWQLSTTPTPEQENIITPRPQSTSSIAATIVPSQGSSGITSSTYEVELVTEEKITENAQILEEEPLTTITETKIVTQKTKFVLAEPPPEISPLKFEGQVLSATSQKENSFSLFKLTLLLEWILVALVWGGFGEFLWVKKLI